MLQSQLSDSLPPVRYQNQQNNYTGVAYIQCCALLAHSNFLYDITIGKNTVSIKIKAKTANISLVLSALLS